jgi:hypothetical protein
MNEQPLVSVVITTRNRPDVVTRAGNVYFTLRLVSAPLAQEEQLDH